MIMSLQRVSYGKSTTSRKHRGYTTRKVFEGVKTISEIRDLILKKKLNIETLQVLDFDSTFFVDVKTGKERILFCV